MVAPSRSAPPRCIGSDARTGLPRGMGPRPGHPDRRPRRFDLAEDATQEAFAMAADRWPRDGVPSNPRAWLMTTARNRATDRIRRDRALAAKFSLLVAGNRAEVPMNTTTFPDERLELTSPGARNRGAGGAHPAHPRRAHHRRDRPRLPGT